jgi:hypothetical protein
VRKIDKQGLIYGTEENISKGCRERRDGSDYPMKAQMANASARRFQ